MVPIRESCGRSCCFGACTGRLVAAAVTGSAAGGGRRDGEKIGRSRVADSCLSGIPHSGLPLGGCPVCVTRWSCAGGEGCGLAAAAASVSDTSIPAGLATPNAEAVATNQKQPNTQTLPRLLIADPATVQKRKSARAAFRRKSSKAPAPVLSVGRRTETAFRPRGRK